MHDSVYGRKVADLRVEGRQDEVIRARDSACPRIPVCKNLILHEIMDEPSMPLRCPRALSFLRSLATAWKDGEVRPTHRAGPKPPRHWRTRKDPLEAVWPRIVTWLESEPDATAKGLLQRLQTEAPGTFPDGLLRTMQRRVKEWRRLAARRLVFASATSAMPA